MPEYRPVPDDREDDRARITSYAFDAPSGQYDPDAETDERLDRMWSFGEDYALFDGDELLVTCTHIEFTTRLRDAWLPMAGVSAVASSPENRRQGLVGDLLEASLADYRDRGWPLSALRPFDESFYARYGWATGYHRHVARVEPSALAPAADAASGRFRRVGPDDYERLVPAYEAWLDGVNLATQRSGDWWRDRVFQSHDSELYGYAWERDGEVRGYVVYDVTDDYELRTHEFAYADHGAYLNLLRFCRDHDSQIAEVVLSGPGHDRLVDELDDRDAYEVEVAAGQMVRIVDVPVALEAVSYPVEHADLTLAVADDHADWNDDRFAVRVRDGEATVERTDADPDASIDVGTLSQLLVGHREVERARVAGDVTVHDPTAVETLAALFPGRPAHLPEAF